jgi:hypothetical protein
MYVKKWEMLEKVVGLKSNLTELNIFIGEDIIEFTGLHLYWF